MISGRGPPTETAEGFHSAVSQPVIQSSTRSDLLLRYLATNGIIARWVATMVAVVLPFRCVELV